MEAADDGGRDGRQTDWALVNTPGRAVSCLRLGPSKPCVNKATALLEKLREHLKEWQNRGVSISQQNPPRSAGKHSTPYAQPPSTEKHNESSLDTTTRSGSPSGAPLGVQKDLVIQGTQTGVTLQLKLPQPRPFPSSSFDWADFSDIIDGALQLVLRLDVDRMETVERFESEREKVKQLRMLLDRKAKHRLTVLPRLVQKG